MASGKKKDSKIEKVLENLQERAKELACLYRVEESLKSSEKSMREMFEGILGAIPPGWQYPEYCQARIEYEGETYKTPGFVKTPWEQVAAIRIQDEIVGHIAVSYTTETPAEDDGPFFREETKLIETIADRLGHTIFHRRLQDMIQEWDAAREGLDKNQKGEWRIVVDLLRKTDQDLFLRVIRHMLNYLCWNGVTEADAVMKHLGADQRSSAGLMADGGNRPSQKTTMDNWLQCSEQVFELARSHLPPDEILSCIEKWIQEDRSSFLIRSVIHLHSSLADISDALRRYQHLRAQGQVELAESTSKGVRVALLRRIISDQLEFIRIAKDYVEIQDFCELMPRLIYPAKSHGQVGGKAAGLLLASLILNRRKQALPLLGSIKYPKTWHVTSDGLHSFLHYNDLEEVTEQKYKDIEIVRQEYPHIIQVFKNAHFTPEIVKGLWMALDDFGDSPIIVRSSSLLEDRLGTAFSGKYTSLFLANQGSKTERLDALMDAIAEVYSSTFGPDPMEYRAARGLLEFREEMGIIIQEVVGTRIGPYFLPSFGGVAFSYNEFRWSPRIKRKDGLIRMVPGLGTRAVDRLSDDYTVLVAPGQPGLRVNTTVEETLRYSPRMMDVINLEKNAFETVPMDVFLKAHGAQLPAVEQMVSVVKDDRVTPCSTFRTDFEKEILAVDFDGLISRSDFVEKVKTVLQVLQDAVGEPVDIEFACDGRDFYLLQCRPQSNTEAGVSQPIPVNVPEKEKLFSANRFVSNGRVKDLTHVVYVDPEAYGALHDHETMNRVSRAVGQLNKMLPKRRFVLMGPGRWGSRGDIRLGVSVSYADISNTAMLVEIARRQGRYVPELSFGTHFFQDLVESSIRYLPLYPDDPDVCFNAEFFRGAPNMLAHLLPDFAALQEVIRVIDVQAATGKVLKVVFNADEDQALAYLVNPDASNHDDYDDQGLATATEAAADDSWRWRLRMAERVAQELDAERFGVNALYLVGSTKNGTAEVQSDIDLLIHTQGRGDGDLRTWLEGWSRCLTEIHFLKSGVRVDPMLHVHLVHDADVNSGVGIAGKINAMVDPARPLP